ncbi:DUF1501 domain-containing protein [Neolewinella agarilytica]|uniref:Por secretion system C-terminal sorting domain-containing protein n=1 Tax=Neolewinella agarilytica TaxID=478744 RepID=A0A1H9M000_9BACT|nr:DUF1501 domain-containing protein [Neolewinella agarilytica]SER17001.1 Por secretion system C-terminal sorting domain-containing protein [Neolewinella agarilytica]
MNRRNFLRTGGALSLPLLANNPLSAHLTRTLRSLVDPDSDRVLVLIQLNGGNDGLSTLVPLDQYANLMQVRQNLMVPEDRLLGIDNNLAFHPSAAGMHELYQEGKMVAVQGVAYPDQNRSHFRSTDIWTSASDAREVVTSGWLGRNYQEDFADFPDNYPNEEHPHPFAIALGNQVTQTCQGVGVNFSMAISNPFNLLALAGGDDTPLPDDQYGDELGFLRTSIVQANAYGAAVQEIAARGQSLVEYPDNRLAEQLKNVAYMISGGLQTNVYVVNLGGFDTHANQVLPNDTSNGEYATLMESLGSSLKAFHDDLTAQGLEKRVLSMTFSEFGRRIRSNLSLGSDHGTAAPLFLMGSCVNAGVLGDNAEVSPDVDVNEGVPLQYDFRDVYGTVFEDWFGLEPERVRSVLGHDYVRLPILEGCASVSTNDEVIKDLRVKLWPNPTAGRAQISFEVEGGHTELSLSDVSGRLLQRIFSRTLPAGTHQFELDMNQYPTGTYFVRLQAGASVASRRLVKGGR